MADARGYELTTGVINWDDDLYFNVDKLGLARAAKYKASVLKGHLKVGDQQYTEENYVTNDETLTVSIDQLDMTIKALVDSVGAFEGIKSVRVSLTTSDVASLGTAFEIMAAPTSADKAYQLIDIKWCLNPSSVLDVGSQNLEVYFYGEPLYLGVILNNELGYGTRNVKGLQIQAGHDVGVEKALYCKLSDDTNPSSGTATLDFYIIYKEIELPSVISE